MELQTVDVLEACKRWDGIADSGQEQRRKDMGLPNVRHHMHVAPSGKVGAMNTVVLPGQKYLYTRRRTGRTGGYQAYQASTVRGDC